MAWKPTKGERMLFLERVAEYIVKHTYAELKPREMTSVIKALDKAMILAEARRWRTSPVTVEKQPPVKYDFKPIIDIASSMKLNDSVELEIEHETNDAEVRSYIQKLRGSLYGSKGTMYFAWSIQREHNSIVLTKRSRGN